MQIEGTQVSQDELFYLKYNEQNDDTKEVVNLKKSIELAKDYLAIHGGFFGFIQPNARNNTG